MNFSMYNVIGFDENIKCELMVIDSILLHLVLVVRGRLLIINLFDILTKVGIDLSEELGNFIPFHLQTVQQLKINSLKY